LPQIDLSILNTTTTTTSNDEYNNYNETEVISNISSIIEESTKDKIKSKKNTYKSKFLNYIKSRKYKKQEYSELIKHNKKSSIEDKFELFIDSDDYINLLNSNLTNSMYGHTKFSDWSMEEKQSILMTTKEAEEETRRRLVSCDSFSGWGSGVSLSSNIDYRWAAQSIQDQSGCGSCWAFASAAQFELNYYFYKGIWSKQNEQYILDCVGSSIGDCDGGYQDDTNAWLAEYGSCSKYGYYLYDGKDTWSCSSCFNTKTTTTNAYAACITEWSTLSGSESYNYWSIVANAAQHVSLSFGMAVSNNFFYLSKGSSTSSSVTVYYNQCDTSDIAGNHAMATYGVSSTGNYLLVRNSWGDDWGDDGYFWLYQGARTSCDFQNYASFNYWS
jgi:C1A family cysteine protease